jgi:hypothetical protein
MRAGDETPKQLLDKGIRADFREPYGKGFMD